MYLFKKKYVLIALDSGAHECIIHLMTSSKQGCNSKGSPKWEKYPQRRQNGRNIIRGIQTVKYKLKQNRIGAHLHSPFFKHNEQPK